MRFLILLLSVFFVLFSFPALAGSTVTINLPAAIQTNSSNSQILHFYDSVYLRLGIKPTYVYAPAKRGFKALRTNQIQAEGYRAQDIGESNAGTLYRVNVPLAVVAVGLFCVDKKKCGISNSQVYALQAGFEHGRTICNALSIQCKMLVTRQG